MPKNRGYNSVGAGVTPKLGNAKPDGLSRPGARARVGAGGGPEAGLPARPGSPKGGRPAKPSRSGGSAPRAARPGSAGSTVNRKPQAKPVPVGQRVR